MQKLCHCSNPDYPGEAWERSSWLWIRNIIRPTEVDLLIGDRYQSQKETGLGTEI